MDVTSTDNLVHDRGELELGVVEAGAQDPARVAEDLCDRWRAQDIDFTRQWPLRMAVIVQDGQPSYMATLISHIAVDAAGLETMMADEAFARGMEQTALAAARSAAAVA